jgi:CheW-like domain
MTHVEAQVRDEGSRGTGQPCRGDPLVLARSGPFRLLVPLDNVEGVLPAALPTARPAAEGAAHPVVSVGGVLLPVLFAEALLGAAEARLRPGDQMLQLKDGVRQALLWVSAVEEVVTCGPLAPPADHRHGLVAGYSDAGGPIAVLDVARAIALALAADCGEAA